MSSHKKTTDTGRKTTAASATKLSKLSEHQVLFGAIENFVRSNDQYGSSIPMNAALEEIGACTDLQIVFPIPLKHCLFGMETALQWLLFLSLAPGRAVELGDEPFPGNQSPSSEFSANLAINLIADVYDVSVQDNIWEHFGEDDEEEEEDEDEGDDDGGDDDGDDKKKHNR